MRKAILPISLRPHHAPDLIRLGSSHDGGYLVSQGDVLASEGLISMGLADDWQFERHFRRMNKIMVHAYDGCTGPGYLLQDTRRAVSARNPRWLARSILKLADYLRFFGHASVRHFRVFVGTAKFAYQESGSPIVGVEQVFAKVQGRHFLKIDIEGAEYALLDELVDRAANTTGLAIEFHDCDTNLGTILRFVERYPLLLVHTHVNSYSSLSERGVPQALELTFSSTCQKARPATELPHPLDAPNDRIAEVALEWA